VTYYDGIELVVIVPELSVVMYVTQCEHALGTRYSCCHVRPIVVVIRVGHYVSFHPMFG